MVQKTKEEKVKGEEVKIGYKKVWIDGYEYICKENEEIWKTRNDNQTEQTEKTGAGKTDEIEIIQNVNQTEQIEKTETEKPDEIEKMQVSEPTEFMEDNSKKKEEGKGCTTVFWDVYGQNLKDKEVLKCIKRIYIIRLTETWIEEKKSNERKKLCNQVYAEQRDGRNSPAK